MTGCSVLTALKGNSLFSVLGLMVLDEETGWLTELYSALWKQGAVFVKA